MACPNIGCWSALLEGGVAQAEQTALPQHLGPCAERQRTLERLTARGTPMLGSARHLGERPRRALALVMENLKAEGEQSMATVGQDTIAAEDMPQFGSHVHPEKMSRIGGYDV